MPLIQAAGWDSDRLGLSAGKVIRAVDVPHAAELERFDYVVVRVPLQESPLVASYERIGFRFITIDYALEMDKPSAASSASSAHDVVRIARESPSFAIEGFEVAGSRFSIDPFLKRRLPPGFWDRMIADHCLEFADFCLCVVDSDGALAGFSSCIETDDAVDIFLLVVHPRATGDGIGSLLVREAVATAGKRHKKLTTSVVSQNVSAMRFYFRSGFLPRGGDIVLHYSREAVGS